MALDVLGSAVAVTEERLGSTVEKNLLVPYASYKPLALGLTLSNSEVVEEDLNNINKLKLDAKVLAGIAMAPAVEPACASAPIPLNKLEVYVTAAAPVHTQVLEKPDLSVQFVIWVPEFGGVPVPSGSEPSNQSCRPGI